MYSNENAVLGTATVAAPTILGILIWPNLVIGFLIAAFIAVGILYFVFKKRNSTK